MSEGPQLELVPSGPKLSDRQRAALEFVENAGGLDCEALGSAMHVRRGKHGQGLCEWCYDEGLAVLKELRRKRLVVRRRGGLWQSLRGSERPALELVERDPQSNEIPF